MRLPASVVHPRKTEAGGDDRSSDAPAQRQKIATILISHRLTDVFAVCGRVVALRHGRVISDEPIVQTSMNAVVTHIVGAA